MNPESYKAIRGSLGTQSKVAAWLNAAVKVAAIA